MNFMLNSAWINTVQGEQDMEQKIYNEYVRILQEELVPAMGCTEPIALAYAAAKAREVLGCIPDKVSIGASGSIIKNVKSVIVPNTNHLKGIPAAAAAGSMRSGYTSSGPTPRRDSGRRCACAGW